MPDLECGAVGAATDAVANALGFDAPAVRDQRVHQRRQASFVNGRGRRHLMRIHSRGTELSQPGQGVPLGRTIARVEPITVVRQHGEAAVVRGNRVARTRTPAAGDRRRYSDLGGPTMSLGRGTTVRFSQARSSGRSTSSYPGSHDRLSQPAMHAAGNRYLGPAPQLSDPSGAASHLETGGDVVDDDQPVHQQGAARERQSLVVADQQALHPIVRVATAGHRQPEAPRRPVVPDKRHIHIGPRQWQQVRLRLP